MRANFKEIRMKTIFSNHIEKPIKDFTIRVLRAACFNVFFTPEHWETWTVKAETENGALKIAQYHFYMSDSKNILLER